MRHSRSSCSSRRTPARPLRQGSRAATPCCAARAVTRRPAPGMTMAARPPGATPAAAPLGKTAEHRDTPAARRGTAAARLNLPRVAVREPPLRRAGQDRAALGVPQSHLGTRSSCVLPPPWPCILQPGPG